MSYSGFSWPSQELYNAPPSFSFPPSSSSSSSSHQHHLPRPSPETSPYIQAIRSAGPHQVKKDLFDAVLRSDKAARLAFLMQLRREELNVKEETRVFLECQRCEKQFDVEKDEVTCLYHSGKLKCDAQDQEDWEDNDGRGKLNTKKNKEEFPHLFKWSCCGKWGDDEGGCRRGKHVEPDAD
ncbi:hypothetical protein BDY24DRAFT_445314 [Mrakia frigida]|uniref:uncharacterized protein n=1 Tax=Mrakia frigida TaxID=29902 RepID=UPI003FCC23FA